MPEWANQDVTDGANASTAPGRGQQESREGSSSTTPQDNNRDVVDGRNASIAPGRSPGPQVFNADVDESDADARDHATLSSLAADLQLRDGLTKDQALSRASQSRSDLVPAYRRYLQRASVQKDAGDDSDVDKEEPVTDEQMHEALTNHATALQSFNPGLSKEQAFSREAEERPELREGYRRHAARLAQAARRV